MIIWWPSASGGTCPVSIDPGVANVLPVDYEINGVAKLGVYQAAPPEVVKAGYVYGPNGSLVGTYGNLIPAAGGISVELPDVSDAMLNWFQPMIFTTIVKTVVAGQLVETPSPLSFMGVWQPFTDRQLMIKPSGQRAWSWFMLHAAPILVLTPDDVVNYEGQQYRVMSQTDYTHYGYYEYHLVKDYTGAGG